MEDRLARVTEVCWRWFQSNATLLALRGFYECIASCGQCMGQSYKGVTTSSSLTVVGITGQA
eukprot:63035-Chlamydomonas_euryale.AAC.9